MGAEPLNGDVKLILGAVRQQGEDHTRQLEKLFARVDALPCSVHQERIASNARALQSNPAGMMSVTSPIFGSIKGPAPLVAFCLILIGIGCGFWYVVRSSQKTQNQIEQLLDPVMAQKLRLGVISNGG